MKNLSKVLHDYYSRLNPASLNDVGKKKYFMINTLEEVVISLNTSSLQNERDIDFNKIEKLKQEYEDLVRVKNESVSKLRDIQTKLMFLKKRTDHLTQKDMKVANESKIFSSGKQKLDRKLQDLKNEDMLDLNIAELEGKLKDLNERNVDGAEKLREIESNCRVLSDEKEGFDYKLKSITGVINVITENLPDLKLTVTDLDMKITEIKNIESNLIVANKKRNNLSEEFFKVDSKLKNYDNEINLLVEKVKELKGKILFNREVDERLKEQIIEMESRKLKMENLNTGIKSLDEKSLEISPVLSDLEGKYEVAGKASKEIEAEIEDLVKKKDSLLMQRSQFESESTEIVGILSEMSAVQTRLESKDEAVKELDDRLANKKRDVTDLKVQLKYYKEAIEEIKEAF